MHLGPLKSRQRAVYTVLHIMYIMSIVSVHIASNKVKSYRTANICMLLSQAYGPIFSRGLSHLFPKDFSTEPEKTAMLTRKIT